MKPTTRVNHPPPVKVPEDNRPLVAPIYQSVKFTFDDVEESERLSRGERDGFVYSRSSNPTLRQLELTLAQLQGREACLTTASGVAATALALLSLCKQGDHVVLFAEMYQPTRYMVRRLLGRYGVRHTMLSIEDTRSSNGLSRVRRRAWSSSRRPAIRSSRLPTSRASLRRLARMAHSLCSTIHSQAFTTMVSSISTCSCTASRSTPPVTAMCLAVRSSAARAPRDDETGLNRRRRNARSARRVSHPAGTQDLFLRYERHCANAIKVAEFLAAHPRSRESASRGCRRIHSIRLPGRRWSILERW